LKTSEHLTQARENLSQAEALMAQATPSGYRWAVVVYFYAANELAHAILDHLHEDIRDKPTVRTKKGEVPVVLRHPKAHGMKRGGTEYSVTRLAVAHAELRRCSSLLRVLLRESYTARYGEGRNSIKPYTLADAQLAAARVAEIESLISLFLDTRP
jgi:hypothetical protein